MVHLWTLVGGGDRSNNLIPSIGGFVLQRLYVKYSLQLTEEGTTVVETLTLKFTFCSCSYVLHKDIIIILLHKSRLSHQTQHTHTHTDSLVF